MLLGSFCRLEVWHLARLQERGANAKNLVRRIGLGR